MVISSITSQSDNNFKQVVANERKIIIYYFAVHIDYRYAVGSPSELIRLMNGENNDRLLWVEASVQSESPLPVYSLAGLRVSCARTLSSKTCDCEPPQAQLHQACK